MFGPSVKIFRLFGFEVRIDASWLIIAALLTWSLAIGVFPREYPGLGLAEYWWMGAVGTLGLFASVVIHELFHSLVARRHNLPMKGITLFIFGGVAQMGGEPSSPKIEFLVAIAGPLSSIGLGFIFYGIYRAGLNTMDPDTLGVVSYLAFINWLLAAFNLIPAFPLDGGRILRSALWHYKHDLRRATRIASTIGSGFGLLLMAFAVFALFTGNFISAIWYFLIGMFLRNASQMSYEQLLIRTALAGEPIRRFMTPTPVTVTPGMSIEELVDEYVYKYHYKMFPVVTGAEKHLEGCVSTKDVSGIPRQEWPLHKVGEVLKPCSLTNTVSPDADALSVLTKMSESGTSRMLVADHDRLLAIVSIKDLLSFIASKLELEGYSPKVPHTP
ncbi:MAG TPA: site-2 protease family protein [Bryobacteraceae bacterium]|nr:site-2 protease family protein [Bryobacteraceae bacterium]